MAVDLRQAIYMAGQTFFEYGMNPEEKWASVSKFKGLDDDGDRRVSFRELKNMRGIMNPAIAVRVCRLFGLVDRDGNGFLDFEECKALFFLVAKGRFCDQCNNLIIRDGVSCLDGSSHSFDLCYYCVHGHSHNQYRFQALQPLISSCPQHLLPPVAFLQAPPQQHRGFTQTAGHVATALGHAANIMSLINACSIM